MILLLLDGIYRLVGHLEITILMKHDVTAEGRYQELGSNPLFFQSSIDPNDRLCHFLEDFITVLVPTQSCC